MQVNSHILLRLELKLFQQMGAIARLALIADELGENSLAAQYRNGLL